MNTESFDVKGSTIRTKLAFARERFGPAAADALDAVLAEHGIARVLEGSWYPFSVYEKVLLRLAEVAYGGAVERLREVGAYSAAQALSTTYQAFARRAELDSFLDLLPQFHARLHTHSSLTIDQRGDRGFVLTLHDLPIESEADAWVSEGFFVACAEQLGCREVRCRRTRDGSDLRFAIRHGARVAAAP